MTPEESWTKIDSAIQALLEVQARHDARLEKHSDQIEKQNAGIRDLVVISRTLIDSQQKSIEAQRATDTRLNTLAENVDRLRAEVDRFLKGLQKPNGNQ